MPLKLLGTIIILVLVTIFAGLNLDNKCDINLIFRQFHEIPVFFSMFLSFLVGMIVALLFSLSGHKPQNKPSSNKKDKADATLAKQREVEERIKAEQSERTFR